MSEFDKLGSLLHHNARRQLTPFEIEQIVRQYRGVVVAEMIVDACMWFARTLRLVVSPARPPTSAKSLGAIAPSRSAAP